MKLLNDIASIESTYNSNHTLTHLGLPKSTNQIIGVRYQHHIEAAASINMMIKPSRAAGRTKVIVSQLYSKDRKELCRMQGIDYSRGSIFADIDPILLPEVLALVGGRHGQRELYRMLLATVPYVASTVNKQIALKERIAEKAAEIAALDAAYERHIADLTVKHLRKTAAITAEKLQLIEDLASIEYGQKNKPNAVHHRRRNWSSGRKRSSSF